MVMDEWGVNVGGVDRCIDAWELIVVKMIFGSLLWLGLGYDKTYHQSRDDFSLFSV